MLAFQTEVETASIRFSKNNGQDKNKIFKKKKQQVLAFQKEETASINFLKMLDEASISFAKRRNSKY